MSELKPLIFDNGSLFTRVGFSGDDIPHAKFLTVTGVQRGTAIINGVVYHNKTCIGDYAISRKGVSHYKHPIQRGLITDMEEMEKIWHYSFHDELQIDHPEDYDVLLTETPLNPKEMKEKMSIIMFESFGVKGLCLANQSVMSLFANDRTTGVVLESGDGITNSVPIYEGTALSHATSRLELAGDDVNEYLRNAIKGIDYDFSTIFGKEALRELKEELCYVAINYEKEINSESSLTPKRYNLPDGNVIYIGNERCKAAEILFQPNLVECQDGGIHEQIFNSIRKCDLDIRKELFHNICLSGGSTMFNGLSERLSNELFELSPPSTSIQIIESPERKDFSWKGGSLFSQLSTFPASCISRMEYQEIGTNIIHRRFF